MPLYNGIHSCSLWNYKAEKVRLKARTTQQGKETVELHSYYFSINTEYYQDFTSIDINSSTL
ncbi:hypothetical protein HMPREF9999_01612 [Alloprevotella sp. oral taxon 473 str. F0040]|nr:hypothetical protein HMPREF9999_01612 [Alloprevotella sp. oral taxon 473 str. F0040]